MGKIVRVELKLYSESEDKDLVIEELQRIFRESPTLILSSIKQCEVNPSIEIDFENCKKVERGEKL